RPRRGTEREAGGGGGLVAGRSVHAASVVGSHLALTPAPYGYGDEVAARRRSVRARGNRGHRRPGAPIGEAQRGPYYDDQEAQAGPEQDRHAAGPPSGRAPDRRPRQRPDPPRRPPPADALALPDGCRQSQGTPPRL